jgi:hypothetical protein
MHCVEKSVVRIIKATFSHNKKIIAISDRLSDFTTLKSYNNTNQFKKHSTIATNAVVVREEREKITQNLWL